MDRIRNHFQLRIITTFCKIHGLWSVDNHRRLYNIWSGICIIYNFLFVAALLAQFVFTLNVNDLYINLSEVTMICKMINLLVYRHRIRRLIHRIHYDTAFHVNEDDPEEVAIVQKRLHNFARFTTFYCCLTSVAVTIGTFNGFGSDTPAMAFNAWYPFGLNDMSVKWKFWLVFVYQTAIISHAWINVVWDNLFLYLLTNVQLQFELLNHRLEKRFKEVTEDNSRKFAVICDHFSAVTR